MTTRGEQTGRTSRPWLALVVAVAALLVGLASASAASARAAPASVPAAPPSAASAVGRAIVTAEHPVDLTGVIAAAGGTSIRAMPAVGAATAELSGRALRRLAAVPGLTVTPDRPVRLTGGAAEGSAPTTMADVAAALGAAGAWRSGATGAGIDVALIDSGVTRVAGLDAPGQVVYGPDLSFDSQHADLADVDGFGHGTHLASLIVGTPDRGGRFTGMAPASRLVSVKVADANGAADVSQIIAAIDWVVQHRNTDGFNIRVLNLSFGTTSDQSYGIDPLAHAAEVAWRHGIVVVTSAGNDGEHRPGLTDPASDPYVLAVGADDIGGSASVKDDAIPSFSSRGDGVRNPDVVAPGTSVVGLRVPGSAIDAAFPSARSGERFFLGTGSSQAAAITSGVVAGMLTGRPDAPPDQVKAVLMQTAASVPGFGAEAQGAGLVRMEKAAGALAADKASDVRQSWAPSTGTGSLEAARGGVHLVDGATGAALDGERDIFGNAFDSAAWADAAAAGSSWTGGVWNGSAWAGSSATASGWSSVRWSSGNWAGTGWDSVRWSGVRWSSVRWSGVRWSSEEWSSVRWSSSGWASVRWG